MARFFFLCFCTHSCYASMTQAQQQGADVAMAANANGEGTFSQETDSGFSTLLSQGIAVSETPPQSHLNEDSLKAATQEQTAQDATIALINKSQNERPVYAIDAENSELNEALEDPQKAFSATQTVTDIDDPGETKVCYSGGESFTQRCQRQRIIELSIIPEETKSTPYCPGNHRGGAFAEIRGGRYCKKRNCRKNTVVVQQKQVNVIKDVWVGCEELDALHAQGKAELEEEVVGPFNQTRIIQGESIQRDYWETTRLYRLGALDKKRTTCEGLRALGCIHVNGVCEEFDTDHLGNRQCRRYKHVYQCPTNGRQTKKRIVGGVSPYCVNGDCVQTPYQANQNMIEALSRLEIMRQSKPKQAGATVAIFKGAGNRCTTNFGGAFKDCCSSSGGIGVNLKMATQCTADEQRLAKERSEERCVFIGSRTKNKQVGIEFSREQVFCCFESKLSRVFQEQARQQLGLSFGTPEEPDCRGLTAEEFQRIKLEQLDLQEVFSDIAQSATKTAERLKMTMAQKQQGLQTPAAKEEQRHKQDSLQRAEGSSHGIEY